VQSWLEERLSAFEIIKASKDLELNTYLSNLEAQDIVAILQDQMLIEKATNCFDKEYIAQVKEELLKANTEHPDTQGESSIAGEGKEGKNPVIKKKKKETNMDENQIKELQKASEQLKEVLKANEDMKVELQKANDVIATFKAEKQAAILKAKVDAVTAVVPNKEHAEVLTKAAVLIQDDAEFTKYVETLKAIHVSIEKNALFNEQGASGGADDSSVTVEKLLKAKFKAN
jgi:ribosomal protein S8E